MRFLSYLLLFSLAFAFSISAQEYIGSNSCGMCHKKAESGEQLKIWEGSAHAKAFKTLQSEKADGIAKTKGFNTKAAETPECLACHVTGNEKDAKFGSKFSKENGVQCEACHGPGSEYKSKKVMEDHAKAVAAGLKDFSKEGSIEAQCKTCHNEKSPTAKEFKFKEMWEKIKHPVPAKG